MEDWRNGDGHYSNWVIHIDLSGLDWTTQDINSNSKLIWLQDYSDIQILDLLLDFMKKATLSEADEKNQTFHMFLIHIPMVQHFSHTSGNVSHLST